MKAGMRRRLDKPSGADTGRNVHARNGRRDYDAHERSAHVDRSAPLSRPRSDSDRRSCSRQSGRLR
jgi:hypothetical protein